MRLCVLTFCFLFFVLCTNCLVDRWQGQTLDATATTAAAAVVFQRTHVCEIGHHVRLGGGDGGGDGAEAEGQKGMGLRGRSVRREDYLVYVPRNERCRTLPSSCPFTGDNYFSTTSTPHRHGDFWQIN